MKGLKRNPKWDDITWGWGTSNMGKDGIGGMIDTTQTPALSLAFHRQQASLSSHIYHCLLSTSVFAFLWFSAQSFGFHLGLGSGSAILEFKCIYMKGSWEPWAASRRKQDRSDGNFITPLGEVEKKEV